LLGHPPDAVELPRRPVGGRADGHVVVLGPDAVRRGGRRQRSGVLRRAPPNAGRLGGAAGRVRLPARGPARAGVAGAARPGLGRVVGPPRAPDTRHRPVRRRPAVLNGPQSAGSGAGSGAFRAERLPERPRKLRTSPSRNTGMPTTRPTTGSVV